MKNVLDNSNNSYYKSLVENSSEIISILDLSGKFIYCNENHEKTTGYPCSKLIGRSAIDLIPENDRRNVKDLFKSIDKSKIEVETVWRIMAEDGRILKLRSRLKLIVDGEQNESVLIYSTDETETYKLNEKKRAVYSLFFDLVSDPEENIKIIVKRACEIFEGTCALYNKVEIDKNQIITWAGYNLPEGYDHYDKADGHICYEAVVKGREKTVAISNLDGSIYEKSDVNVRKYKLKSYIGCSVDIQNKKVGSLCVVYTVYRNFNEEDKEIIHTLAKALSLEEMRKDTEQKLKDTIAEKEFLMKEINHRVKNNLMMITSLIKIKENTLESSDFSDVIHQIDAIRIIHERLYNAGDIRKLDVKPYFIELIDTIFESFSGANVVMNIDIANIKINSKQLITLGLIINEIATNSIKYAYDDCKNPEFNLIVKEFENNHCEIYISNNGKPMPENVNLEYPKTLGMRLIKALTDQLKGEVQLSKHPSSEYRIEFEIEKGNKKG
ncbi:MAG TPA: hypothetical protein DCO79_17020 [Spirochaeta sp.]|nr:hypothetical protein [Spirochaeta sp.]